MRKNGQRSKTNFLKSIINSLSQLLCRWMQHCNWSHWIWRQKGKKKIYNCHKNSTRHFQSLIHKPSLSIYQGEHLGQINWLSNIVCVCIYIYIKSWDTVEQSKLLKKERQQHESMEYIWSQDWWVEGVISVEFWWERWSSSSLYCSWTKSVKFNSFFHNVSCCKLL